MTHGVIEDGNGSSVVKVRRTRSAFDFLLMSTGAFTALLSIAAFWIINNPSKGETPY